MYSIESECVQRAPSYDNVWKRCIDQAAGKERGENRQKDTMREGGGGGGRHGGTGRWWEREEGRVWENAGESMDRCVHTPRPEAHLRRAGSIRDPRRAQPRVQCSRGGASSRGIVCD